MKSSDGSTKATDAAPDLEEAIQRIAEGDQDALLRLYDKTSHKLFGLALKILKDTFAAEEVLLDVYTQVWRRSAGYDPGRAKPLAWLLTIARTRAIDRMRSAHPETGEPENYPAREPSGQESPEEESVLIRQQEMVRSALASVEPDLRRVLELAYYGGLSHCEIAAKVDEPPGSVQSRLRLGIMQLYDLLQPPAQEQI